MLLRGAVAAVALAKGSGYLIGAASVGTVIASVVSLAVGSALLVGFLTPLASGLVAVGAFADGVCRITAGGLENTALFALVGMVATSLTLLGPGALSLDSRLFGRREIIIPPSPRSQKP